MTKNPDAFRTISEVADDVDLPQHVLRFWESRFPQIKPLKRAGGRRFYRPADVELLLTIKSLLYSEGYTIKGVQRLLKDQGVKALSGVRAGDITEDPPLALEGSEQGADDGLSENESATPSRLDEEANASHDRDTMRLLPEERESLSAALGVIIACEEILRTARRATP